MSREGLIKITGEDNIFYDSIKKVYRYRMHCPICRNVSGCRCFEDLEDVLDASMSDLDFCCTYKCSIIGIKKYKDNEIENIMSAFGITDNIEDLTEEDAKSILCEMDIDKLDYDYIDGEAC